MAPRLIPARDGVRLHVDRAGSGSAVVLIAGLGGSAAFWNPVRPALAEAFDLVLPDHRGAGRSDRPAGPYTIDLLARDVIDMLDALAIGRASLVGHSTGGVIAQVVALAAPERVARLVLSGTWARPDAHFRLLFETRLAILERAGAQAYAQLSQLLAYPPSWIAAHGEDSRRAAARAAEDMEPLDVAAARIRMLLADDGRADLQRITAPTLVLGAADDAIVPFHNARALASEIAGARLERIDGGHFFPITAAEAFIDLVSTFLGADR